MKIAISQLNPTLGDLGGNVEMLIERASSAKAAGADLIVFPAYALAGAWADDLLDSGAFARDCESALTTFAISSPLPAIFATPLPTASGGTSQKSVFCFDSTYEVLEPDEERFPTVEYAGKRIAVVMDWQLLGQDISGEEKNNLASDLDLTVACISESYDQWSADATAKDVFFQAKSFAISHGTPLAIANLVGGADDSVFYGGSGLYDAEGLLLCGGALFSEATFLWDLEEEPKDVDSTCESELGTDESDYNALVLATRDYVLKSGFSSVLVGLSGGLDSSLVATIATDAFGPENVHGILMPGPYSSDGSVTDAHLLAQNLGIETHTIPLDPTLSSFLDTIEKNTQIKIDGLAHQNAQARIRGMYLMTLSNQLGSLVLNTGNKSEAYMGYSTLYGDTVGSFSPLADVYKTRAYALARYRNNLGSVIPSASIEKDPSAELAEGQRDQDTLPPYEMLDTILALHVDDGLSVSEIAEEGYDRDLVIDIVRRVSAAEFKRSQEPIGPKITRSNFGFGHVWPLVNRWVDLGS